MGRVQVLLVLAVLIFFATPWQVRAQAPIVATSEAALQPEMPRRLLFTLEAESTAGDLVEARLFFRPTGSSTRVSEPVRFDPAARVSLEHEWQMQLNGTPPGAQIEYFWRLTDSAGNSLETPKQVILALDPRFEWQTVEDEELAIHWYDGGAAWGQEMFETGKQALAQLEEELGSSIESQIRLVAYASSEDFRGAFPPQQDWIGGQAFPSLGVTVQIIAEGDRRWMETVLFHELSHLVFHQALEGSLATAPAWLDEGLAMYNEPESRDSEARVREAAENNQLLPYSALQGNFGADGPTVGLAYAQSQMIVTYLIEDCGRDGFQAMIENMVEGSSVDRALEEACGYDSLTLYNEWRQTLPNAPDPSAVQPAPAGEVAPREERPATGLANLPSWLLPFAATALCFIGLLTVGIVAIAIRLMRPRST